MNYNIDGYIMFSGLQYVKLYLQYVRSNILDYNSYNIIKLHILRCFRLHLHCTNNNGLDYNIKNTFILDSLPYLVLCFQYFELKVYINSK